MTVFIGDVHGKYGRYKKIIGACTDSIQVGDMGVGFRRTRGYREGEVYGNPPYAKMKAGNHRFIRGNHDNPAVCRKHSQWIADGTIENDTMFIGGGFSVDREYRTKDYDWWEDEELSYEELKRMIDIYQVMQPRIMVTHECPKRIGKILCGLSERHYYVKCMSRTSVALDGMFELHQPELWIFGHYHFSMNTVIDGTRFVCLNELEARNIG